MTDKKKKDGTEGAEPAGELPVSADEPREVEPYFIVNPAGAVHGCTREHAAMRLRQQGYRLATDEEKARLKAQNGHQEFDRPIAPRLPPLPEA